MAGEPLVKRPNTLEFTLADRYEEPPCYDEVCEELVSRNIDGKHVHCLMQKGRYSYLLTLKSTAHALTCADRGLKLFDEKVQLSSVTGGPVWLRIMDCPFEVPDQMLGDALSFYGTVKKHERIRVRKELGGFCTGERRVLVVMQKPVPNIMTVAGFEITVWYRDVNKMCRKCGKQGHISVDCSGTFPKARRCGICGNRWHTTEDCHGCARCQTDTHSSDGCPFRDQTDQTIETPSTESPVTQVPMDTETIPKTGTKRPSSVLEEGGPNRVGPKSGTQRAPTKSAQPTETEAEKSRQNKDANSTDDESEYSGSDSESTSENEKSEAEGDLRTSGEVPPAEPESSGLPSGNLQGPSYQPRPSKPKRPVPNQQKSPSKSGEKRQNNVSSQVRASTATKPTRPQASQNISSTKKETKNQPSTANDQPDLKKTPQKQAQQSPEFPPEQSTDPDTFGKLDIELKKRIDNIQRPTCPITSEHIALFEQMKRDDPEYRKAVEKYEYMANDFPPL